MRRIVIATLMVFLSAPLAHGQITNGDFTGAFGGWSFGASGLGGVSVESSSGNPGYAAVIFANGGLLTEPDGSGYISQSFSCGTAGGETICVISFQYRQLFDSGVSVRLEAIVDGNVEHAAVLQGTSTPWTNVSFSVPCGDHTLILRAVYLDGGVGDDWRVYLDNVTAECEAAVSEERQSWGSLKAEYGG